VDSQTAIRSALGFAILGVVASVGSFVSGGAARQAVLGAVAATFFFGALLTYVLSSEQYLPATVHESISADMAENGVALIDAYDLEETFVYLPRQDPSRHACVFVPKNPDYRLPNDRELDSLLVTSPDDDLRGVSLRPTGATLVSRFRSMLEGELSSASNELAAQLADGLVEGYELADHVDLVRSGEESIEFGVSGSVHGDSSGFDDPIQSFLAVGLTAGLDLPVVVESTSSDESQYEYTVTCRWVTDERANTRRAKLSQEEI